MAPRRRCFRLGSRSRQLCFVPRVQLLSFCHLGSWLPALCCRLESSSFHLSPSIASGFGSSLRCCLGSDTAPAMLRCLAPASTLDSSSSLFCRLGPRLLAPSSMPPPRVLPLVNAASTPAPPCTAAAAAASLSMLLPRLCVDSGSSLFCRLGSWLSAPVYAAASSPALLLSSLEHCQPFHRFI